ncbi:cucumopine synthase-related protein [Streptomyces puniciscabiei]
MTTTGLGKRLALGDPVLRELTERLRTEEPEEIRQLRTGMLAHRAGSYGQYFTTWDLANGILRDYSMNVYQWLRVAADDSLTVEQVMTVLRTVDPIYSTYLGYSGFETLARAAERLLRRADHDRASLLAGLTDLTAYVNRLTAWSHHEFPWHLGGDRFRYPEDGMGAPACAYSPTAGGVTPAGQPQHRVRVRLRWEPPGLEAVGEIATDLNEELTREFLASLPFTVLQDHAVVSGETMYAWTPLVSLASTPVTERICDAPVGRLRYSQATGNKLVVQYGPSNEPLRVPVLGQVVPEDLEVLRKVGALVWESTFRSKEPVWLTVRGA